MEVYVRVSEETEKTARLDVLRPSQRRVESGLFPSGLCGGHCRCSCVLSVPDPSLTRLSVDLHRRGRAVAHELSFPASSQQTHGRPFPWPQVRSYSRPIFFLFHMSNKMQCIQHAWYTIQQF